MNQKTVRKLEKELYEAISDVVCRRCETAFIGRFIMNTCLRLFPSPGV
jgi:hypothetical protein